MPAGRHPAVGAGRRRGRDLRPRVPAVPRRAVPVSRPSRPALRGRGAGAAGRAARRPLRARARSSKDLGREGRSFHPRRRRSRRRHDRPRARSCRRPEIAEPRPSSSTASARSWEAVHAGQPGPARPGGQRATRGCARPPRPSAATARTSSPSGRATPTRWGARSCWRRSSASLGADDVRILTGSLGHPQNRNLVEKCGIVLRHPNHERIARGLHCTVDTSPPLGMSNTAPVEPVRDYFFVADHHADPDEVEEACRAQGVRSVKLAYVGLPVGSTSTFMAVIAAAFGLLESVGPEGPGRGRARDLHRHQRAPARARRRWTSRCSSC